MLVENGVHKIPDLGEVACFVVTIKQISDRSEVETL